MIRKSIGWSRSGNLFLRALKISERQNSRRDPPAQGFEKRLIVVVIHPSQGMAGQAGDDLLRHAGLGQHRDKFLPAVMQ
jgi:hypothetical protein